MDAVVVVVHHFICQEKAEKTEKEKAQKKKGDPEAWFRGGSFHIYILIEGFGQDHPETTKKKKAQLKDPNLTFLQFQVDEKE